MDRLIMRNNVWIVCRFFQESDNDNGNPTCKPSKPLDGNVGTPTQLVNLIRSEISFASWVTVALVPLLKKRYNCWQNVEIYPFISHHETVLIWKTYLFYLIWL